MSFQKYLKYKTKYLNIVNNMSGGQNKTSLKKSLKMINDEKEENSKKKEEKFTAWTYLGYSVIPALPHHTKCLEEFIKNHKIVGPVQYMDNGYLFTIESANIENYPNIFLIKSENEHPFYISTEFDELFKLYQPLYDIMPHTLTKTN